MDMAGWVLLRSDRQEVPVSTYLDQDLVEADLSDVPDVSQDLHWLAPQAYLGDKVSPHSHVPALRLSTVHLDLSYYDVMAAAGTYASAKLMG